MFSAEEIRILNEILSEIFHSVIIKLQAENGSTSFQMQQLNLRLTIANIEELSIVQLSNQLNINN